jgi:hypothetical protein
MDPRMSKDLDETLEDGIRLIKHQEHHIAVLEAMVEAQEKMINLLRERIKQLGGEHDPS